MFVIDLKEQKKAVKFAEWISENHYRLYDVTDNIYTWKHAEGNTKTSQELFFDYKRENEF